MLIASPTAPDPIALLYSSLSFGFGLTVAVWVFFRCALCWDTTFSDKKD